jgi:hypothetical protein
MDRQITPLDIYVNHGPRPAKMELHMAKEEAKPK